MDKIVRLGTGKTYGNRWMSVYCHIKYDGKRLSITGVEGPLPSGNCLGSFGQITMPDIQNCAPGWDHNLIRRFFQVWDRWHLNDMRSACEHQRALGWYKDHSDPKTFKGEACPECGYHIDSAWLTETVPDDVIAFLESLPNTDRTPAWA